MSKDTEEVFGKFNDQQYANAIRAAVIHLQEIVQGAKKAGLDVALKADRFGCTSDARVYRNLLHNHLWMKGKRNEQRFSQ